MIPARDAIAHITRENVATAVQEGSKSELNLFLDDISSTTKFAWRSILSGFRVLVEILPDDKIAAHHLCAVGIVTAVDAAMDEAEARKMLVKFSVALVPPEGLAAVDSKLQAQEPRMLNVIRSGASKASNRDECHEHGLFPESDASPLDGKRLSRREKLCMEDGVLTVTHKFYRAQGYLPAFKVDKYCDDFKLAKDDFKKRYGPSAAFKQEHIKSKPFSPLGLFDRNGELVPPNIESIRAACLNKVVKCTFVLEAWHFNEVDRKQDLMSAALVEMAVLGPIPPLVKRETTPEPEEDEIGPVTPTSRKRFSTRVIDSPSRKMRLY